MLSRARTSQPQQQAYRGLVSEGSDRVGELPQQGDGVRVLEPVDLLAESHRPLQVRLGRLVVAQTRQSGRCQCNRDRNRATRDTSQHTSAVIRQDRQHVPSFDSLNMHSGSSVPCNCERSS